MSAQPAQQPVHYNAQREGDPESFAHDSSSSDDHSEGASSSTTEKRGIVSANNIVSVITRKDIQIAYVA